MEAMTGRERILTACRNGQPDRIPATPDISIMIPIRMTGRPFYEVEVNRNPDMTFAYINAVRYFGIDGWMFNGTLEYRQKSEISVDRRIISKDDASWKVQTIIHTPDGDLSSIAVHPYDNPGTEIEKSVKDFKSDFKKIRHLYSDITSFDATIYRQQKREIGDLGMICCFIAPPGLQNYGFMGLEELTYAYYDYPELFEELCEMHDKLAIQKMEMAVDAGVESILTGGSGSITMQSPELFRKLSLPTIKKLTKMAKEAGIVSGIHSCGKEFEIVEACANETDLDYINPLEIPPMGDCNLAEVKARFGHKIALMGNLHTTSVMLFGSTDDVRRESLKAIRDAGLNGGFILSTGDQCGRETPDANIFEMVKVAKEFGRYPLDMDRIESELDRLN